ncbi:MAG: YfhO family protein [Candidatus Cloacimonetes bacterium]|nr:YfhO family protein [Candidatus Cloacimonadota bacterium]
MSQKKVNPKMRLAANPQPAAKAPASYMKYLPWILAAFLFLFVSILYFPAAYKHMEPQASDINQWRGAAKSIIDYNEEHNDRALWTQNMFSGMPSYMISFPNRYPFLENITKLTDKVISWRIFLLIMGGLGMFVLLLHLKLDPYIAFFGAIAFVFSCHWVGLLEIGHNTKFRAMMYVPWVMWSIMYLRAKPGILSLGLSATFLITQLRENHPQISYYLYLLIGMYWVYQAVVAIKKKQVKHFGIWTLLLVLAFSLTALAVMNPYLSTMEYSKYTMRGSESGLDKVYAQGWSFHPKEIIGFIIPDFWGGINQSYWGYMPFTQIYNYFGIVVLAFGVLALWGRRRRLALFLWLASAAFTLMSFGSSTPALSDLFLNYLPYFNKFRVPSMTLVIVQFNAVILAALGIKSILENSGNAQWQKRYLKIFWICGAIFILWMLFAKSVFAGLPYTTAIEQMRYEEANALSQLDSLILMRKDILVKSGILSLMLLAVSMGLAYLNSIKKLKAAAFILLITLITFIDLWIYTGKHLKDLHPKNIRQSTFRMQDFDNFLLNDKDNFRIYPFNTNQIRSAGEWAYFHQSIDGYSAAKLKRYDEVLPLINGRNEEPGEFVRYLRGVYRENSSENPTPVLDMLATKYIIVPDSLPYASMFQNFRPVYKNKQVSIYQNLKALPRAWFAQNIVVSQNTEETLKLLKDTSFDPASTAILETQIDAFDYPLNGRITQTKAELHELSYEYDSDTDALIVLSEIYYPAGWKAYVDGKEIPIYPANHILRALRVPAGTHTLELVLAPQSYQTGVTLSFAGLLITILALIVGSGLYFFKKPSKTV